MVPCGALRSGCDAGKMELHFWGSWCWRCSSWWLRTRSWGRFATSWCCPAAFQARTWQREHYARRETCFSTRWERCSYSFLRFPSTLIPEHVIFFAAWPTPTSCGNTKSMLPTPATAEKLEFAAVSMHPGRCASRPASHAFGEAQFLRKPVNNRDDTGRLACHSFILVYSNHRAKRES